MALRLFEHNEKAYHAAIRMMEQDGKAPVVHLTGTGKSYIAFKLIEDNSEKVVIWLSPSEYIFKTQLESLKKLCPKAKLLGLTTTNIRYLDNNRDIAEELFDGHIAIDMTLGEAVVRSILPAPKYVTTLSIPENACKVSGTGRQPAGTRHSGSEPEISGCAAPGTGTGGRFGQGLCSSYHE